MNIKSSAAAAALALLAAQPARAGVYAPTFTPQNFTIFTQVSVGNTSSSSFSSGYSTLAIGGVSATATANSLPSPHETVFATANRQASTVAYSTLTYYFGVNTDTPVLDGTSVDVVISASGFVTQSQISSGNTAALYFGSPSSASTLIGYACTNYFAASCGGANHPTFSTNVTETLKVGYQYSLTLSLYVAANVGVTGHESDEQYGYIDPIISFVSPADADLYSLALSPDVGNSPIAAVPEPSTWAMMIAGFAGLAWLGARRRRRAAAAA